ncbi:MAG: lysyl oxidase family protein [Gammaproteobacteria bacterium]|nr:lysyl oxidase family protein [Gammaproteobacteria bacterium]MDH3375012.1 lysyl oxidase family protein [Gammaproteobacteria bacterium]MDH3409280.1 lysyl oxidase family protein [Gammaproteobacteria bacterium]MDH3552164.1 lysyl oxidase family protein [Gammaproteobacteria bacterium]
MIDIPSRTNSVFLAATLIVSLGLTSNASAQQPLLPNLTALPAFHIHIAENPAGKQELRFSFRSWNSGDGRFELIAGELAQGRQNIYQRIYNDDGSYEDVLAGDFEWHSGHSHFHFDDYALYLLQQVTGNSQKTSTKTSFCLMDTDLVDGTLPGAPSSPQYVSCGNFFQGISVGYGDTYGWHLPGQEISLKNLKDGDYRLITEVDPQNRIMETDDSDNEACVLLNLVTSTPTPTVTILNESSCDGGSEPPPGGEVTVDSITPNSAPRDSSVSVLITGSGFASGMEVSLENGSGARPTVSVVNVDEQNSTITAVITLKKGAKAGNWDVRVGSGVLPGGFTVTVP